MKETTFKLINDTITLAHENGLIPRDNIKTLGIGDPEMICKVCNVSEDRTILATRPLLVFFSGLCIPIHRGNLEKNREKMTPALAKMLATIINAFVEYFIACDDWYTQSFDFINYEESPEDILKAFEEIVENLRTYH